MTRFTVTEEHLKLARRANLVDWVHAEFGAFSQDPKRPYGNSNVYGDMADILGLLTPDREADVAEGEVMAEDVMTEEQLETCDQLHGDMGRVFTIAAQTGAFKMGVYETEDDFTWREVPDWQFCRTDMHSTGCPTRGHFSIFATADTHVEITAAHGVAFS